MPRWNTELSVQHLTANAKSGPTGLCAKFVRQAIEAGGVTLVRHGSAKDYGSSLLQVGFVAIEETIPERGKKGDVVIMQAIGDHIHGHMQMYSGNRWVSDYSQNGFYPYTHSRPEYQVYRYPAPTTALPSTPAFPPYFNPGGIFSGLVGGAPPSSTLSREPVSEETPYPGKAFRVGNQGQSVIDIQRRLTTLGWPLTDDGKFGNLTKSAVVSFQRTKGLVDDGVVGRNTWAELFA